MEIESRTQTEARRVIEINNVEFYVEDLVEPLGWLRFDEVNDDLVNTTVLKRMEEAGLVREKSKKSLMKPDDEIPRRWEQVDGKCRELFDELNEPYYRLRPKVATTRGFGVWDEQEDENAREEAEDRLEELRERNPDVEWEMDEEEVSSITIRE